MNMKEAFDSYFKKLSLSNQEHTGHMPKVVYIKQCNLNGIYLMDTLDNYGYAEWQPVLQKGDFNFIELETKLGFSINPDIKDFYSTSWFMQLYGNYNGYNVFIDKIPPNCDLEHSILSAYNHGDHDYMNPGIFFCIGDVDSDLLEDCSLYVENNTGCVYGVDWNDASDSDYSKPFSECSFLISDSLKNLINELKVKAT